MEKAPQVSHLVTAVFVTPEDLKSVLARCLEAGRSELPLAELPDFLAELERIKALAWARLQAPIAAPHDELLDISQASRRLGVSRSYLYRHQNKYAFVRRDGRKLLFSALGIDAYIQQKGPTAFSLLRTIKTRTG